MILVDFGISQNWTVDGKAGGGFPAWGGTQWALREFEKAKISIKEMEMVLYLHLHDDPAGCRHLFHGATHVFQGDEWQELIDPLPSMNLRSD